jgi:uncharacterized protein (TIGR03437 family)
MHNRFPAVWSSRFARVFLYIGFVATLGSIPCRAQTIVTLSPSTGAVGSVVRISGKNFGGIPSDGTVMFNGTNASLTHWSDSLIVVTVPDGATSGPVVVTVRGVATNSVYFKIEPSSPASSSSSR